MDKDLDKWVDVWEKANKENIFGDTAKPPVPTTEPDFFGNWREPTKPATTDVPLNEVDAKYWNKIYRLSRHQGDAPDIIKEDLWEKPQDKKLRDTPEKGPLGNVGAELSNAPNPTYPSTRGMDQRNKVTPDWADGPKLQDIDIMKRSLYKLECKLNASPKFGSYGPDAPEIKKIQSQINELKDKIDKLSDDLSPDFIGQESD